MVHQKLGFLLLNIKITNIITGEPEGTLAPFLHFWVAKRDPKKKPQN